MENQEKEVLDVAFLAGNILLESGAEIFRVEETVDRIARAYGIEEYHSFVLTNGIFATYCNSRGEIFAKVKNIPVSSARLNKVAAVNQLSREIETRRYPIEEVKNRLNEIRQMEGKKNLTQIVASGVGAGCFCYLFGGTFGDAFSAFLTGAVLYCYVLYVSCYQSKIIANMSGAALVTIVSILLFHIFPQLHLSLVIIGAIMPLLPGVTFTNGIRDIADGDYLSGTVRLLDALLVAVCIAAGVGAVIIAYHNWLGGIML